VDFALAVVWSGFVFDAVWLVVCFALCSV